MKQKIGNDLVDLLDPQSQDKWKNPRFLSRICTVEEQQLILRSVDPHSMLWTLWACKEASFKAIKKELETARFIPNEYVCSHDLQKNSWRCQFRHLHCEIKVENKSNCVHAIAILHGDADQHAHETQLVSNISELPLGLSPSQAVRKQAVQLLAERGYRNCLIIRKEEDGRVHPPTVFCHGRALADCDLSLSHDGQWTGAVLIFSHSAASLYKKEHYATV